MVLVLVEISTSECSLRCRRPSVSGSVAIESGFVEIEKLESVFVIDRLVSIGDAWFGHVLVFGLHSCSRTQRCRPIRARSRYRVQNFRLVLAIGFRTSGSFSLSGSGSFSPSGSGSLMSLDQNVVSGKADHYDGRISGCRLWEGRSLQWPDQNLVSGKADHCDGRISELYGK